MPLCGTTEPVGQKIASNTDTTAELTVQQVKAFLKIRPALLEEILINDVNEEFLIRALGKKKKKSEITAHAELPVWDCATSGTEIAHCKTGGQVYNYIYSVVAELARVVRADVFYMFVICENGLGVYEPDDNVQPIEHMDPVTAYVATAKTAVNVSAPRLKHDPRFNKGIDPKTGCLKLCHTVAVPILTESLAVFAIIQFERPKEFDTFTRDNFDVISAMLGWVTPCVQGILLNNNMRAQSKLNQYTAKISRALFENVRDLDDLKANIVTVAKEIVPCSQCILRLGKTSRNGGFDHDDNTVIDEDVLNNNMATDRFTPNETDQRADSVSPTTLSIPLRTRGAVLGVLNMANRVGGDHFTPEDVDSLRLFAAKCSLAISYHHIFESLRDKECKTHTAKKIFEEAPVCANEDVNAFEMQAYLTDAEVSPYFDKDLKCFDFDSIPKAPSSNNFKTVFKLMSESDMGGEKWDTCIYTNENISNMDKEAGALNDDFCEDTIDVGCKND